MDELPEPTTDPPPEELQNGGGDERCTKKAKVEQIDDDSEGDLKRVAEIVLVLSTMAAVRGGKKPTDVEVELMKEARTKLAVLCQGIAPKDIVSGEAIDTVIEDLGLNAKVGDQRLGFRNPKTSIAERYSYAKSKVFKLSAISSIQLIQFFAIR